MAYCYSPTVVVWSPFDFDYSHPQRRPHKIVLSYLTRLSCCCQRTQNDSREAFGRQQYWSKSTTTMMLKVSILRLFSFLVGSCFAHDWELCCSRIWSLVFGEIRSRTNRLGEMRRWRLVLWWWCWLARVAAAVLWCWHCLSVVWPWALVVSVGMMAVGWTSWRSCIEKRRRCQRRIKVVKLVAVFEWTMWMWRRWKGCFVDRLEAVLNIWVVGRELMRSNSMPWNTYEIYFCID